MALTVVERPDPRTADPRRAAPDQRHSRRGRRNHAGRPQTAVNLMDGAERLSFTFRFQDGSTELDRHSQQNLADLARLLEAGQFRDETLILAGFSDGSGVAAANLDLSRDRALRVLLALNAAAPGLTEAQLPRIEAFGEALPMACDETAAGRRLNRRVELWLKPAFVKDTPRTGN